MNEQHNSWIQEPEVETEDRSSILLSIGDLMSGLLMIFALLFITVLIQLKERTEPIRIVVGTVLEAMKANNVNVEVNPETGDISIRDSILFDDNSAVLKPEGQKFLQSFIPIYSQVIFSRQEIEEEVTRVIIEGHTSSRGSYEANLELSLLRAFSVANYIFSELNFETKPEFSQKIMTAGRGEIEARQDIDDPADRKVIFRFQFRGQELSQWSQNNLQVEEER